MSHTLVIVGAGFSGITTFYRLLSSGQRNFSRIILVDDGKTGGLAYGYADDLHRLNVPAGRMSALIEDDDHFLNFARYVLPQTHASDFVPRQIYGAYLRWMLDTAKRKSNSETKAVFVRDRVVDICISRNGTARVELQSGKSISAKKVIIATGNQQSHKSKLAVAEFAGGPRYIAHPWPVTTLEQLSKGPTDPARPLLIIGSGLTAIDIVMSLQRRWPDQPIIMLSRHGLLPQAHRGLSSKPEAAVDVSSIAAASSNARLLLRAMREKIREVESAAGDWRDVIAALRHSTPVLWHELPLNERKRFLRHGRAYWEAHRHRLPPDVAEKLQQLQQQRLLGIEAGRIIELQNAGDEFAVVLRRRGSQEKIRIVISAAIDCTGPETRIANTGSELLQSLHKRGLIGEDALQLGILVADDYAVVDSGGEASAVIHYIGPWLRAQYWEATAVPELRKHAAALVDVLSVETASSNKSTKARKAGVSDTAAATNSHK